MSETFSHAPLSVGQQLLFRALFFGFGFMLPVVFVAGTFAAGPAGAAGETAAGGSSQTEQAGETWAERLGFPKGTRAAILHVDDVGMSHDSNVGLWRSALEGVANSASIMMPCPWVPEFFHWLEDHPDFDAGLHLTLTSEWSEYRWGPLLGKDTVPGLVDSEGAMWSSVAEVVANATADEVEQEIRAQVERARAFGWEPTHLDSHMGTLFATDEFLERYMKVGIELGIPVMIPAGHNTALENQYRDEAIEQLKRAGKYEEGMKVPLPENLSRSGPAGQLLWQAGLPVIDDLHNTSYGWRLPEGEDFSVEAIRELKVKNYQQAIRELEPGVTMIIMHATVPSENFEFVSTSGPTRHGDALAMMDPRLRKTIEEEGVVLTTWRELYERRKAIDR